MLNSIRQIIELFDRRERWMLGGLSAVMVISALIQALGVASILPFMGLVANPEMIEQTHWMQRLYDHFGFDSTRSFLVFAGVLVLLMMTLSNFAAAFEHWLLLHFIWRKQHRVSVRLLQQYTRQPYSFYLKQNTSDLAKNILSEVGDVLRGVLLPLMKMLAQLLVIIFVFALLVSVDAGAALTAALVLPAAYGLIFAAIKRKQARLGIVRRTANALRFKEAAEALGSIKETRVLGREAEFVRRFAKADRRYTDANAWNAMVADAPKYVLETMAFGGILVMVLYFLETRADFGEAVAMMSLYALAGYRLMPALQQVFRGITQTRFFLPALDGLHADLGSPLQLQEFSAAVDSSPPIEHRGLFLDDVVYRYPDTNKDVVKGITLEVRRNTTAAFVGSTGCGKTTLVDILLGLLDVPPGVIRVDGIPLSQDNMRQWQSRVGYVPQQIFLSDDTIRKNIAFGIPDRDISDLAVERAARIAHVHDFIMSLPGGFDTVIGEHGVRLSGGQRQRIGIARALYHDPEVLIMDEATSALDGITEDAIIRAIRDLSRQKTIIVVAHRLTTVRSCDAIYLLDNGRIVASGTYDELMQKSPRFRAMASEPLEPTVAV